MKKTVVIFLSLAIFVGLGFLSSCNKNSDAKKVKTADVDKVRTVIVEKKSPLDSLMEVYNALVADENKSISATEKVKAEKAAVAIKIAKILEERENILKAAGVVPASVPVDNEQIIAENKALKEALEKLKCSNKTIKEQNKAIASLKKIVKDISVYIPPNPADVDTNNRDNQKKNQNVGLNRETIASVEFCIHLGGGKYWPHYAMDRGESFPEARKNGLGTGWNLLINFASDDLVGQYGITSDGTTFVSAEEIDKYLQASVPEIVSNQSDWTTQKMEKFNGYYIWHRVN